MDRERALPLALALLAVVSLAVAAATIDSAVVTDGATGAGGDDAGFGDERRDSGDDVWGHATPGDRSSSGAFAPCAPFLREPPALVAAGLVLAGLFAAAYRSTRSGFASAVVVGGIAFPLGLVWAAVAYCPELAAGGGENVSNTRVPNMSWGGTGGSGGVARTGRDALASPTLLVVLLTVIAVGVVAVAIYATGSDDDGDAEEEVATPDPPAEDAPEEIGRVAGLAADRIDGTDGGAENEVYRAWREMADSLEVASPETTTPREFQRAAVDAGMAAGDVDALTSLFEAVRYGDRAATEDVERRAVETLRRIESSYGGE